ncbi:MAG: hypothetical protein ACPL1A_03310 [Candidatus Kapaibacteriota bacterium]
MEFNICQSTNRDDYEILIRKRGGNKYASYCPQINFMLQGTEHEEVYEAMMKKIDEHILKIKLLQNSN